MEEPSLKIEIDNSKKYSFPEIYEFLKKKLVTFYPNKTINFQYQLADKNGFIYGYKNDSLEKYINWSGWVRGIDTPLEVDIEEEMVPFIRGIYLTRTSPPLQHACIFSKACKPGIIKISYQNDEEIIIEDKEGKELYKITVGSIGGRDGFNATWILKGV